MKHGKKMEGTNAFFLPPFFPLEMRLFFPTAMAHCVRCEKQQLRMTTRATMAPKKPQTLTFYIPLSFYLHYQ